MKTNIEIKIDDIGNASGTLGWLLAQSIRISIGPDNEGRVCAWLAIGTQHANVSCHGWQLNNYGAPDPMPGRVCASPIERMERTGTYQHMLAFETQFTDAAWAKVMDLINLARVQFENEIARLDAKEAALAETIQFLIVPTTHVHREVAA